MMAKMQIRRRPSFLFLAVLCLLGMALPAAASAELQSFDFESGPALGTPVDGFGNVHFVKGLGFRPYRTTVGARAHSGTTVGDLGRCLQEESEASNCENFEANTFAQLDRTATSVTLFAGTFADDPTADPEQATLRAFRANGTLVGISGPAAIDDNGFNTQLSVSNQAGEIASFEVFAVRHGAGGDAPAGDLGIDDVRVNFADGAKPDLSVSTTNQVIPLVQGTTVDVPVNLSRVNGSTGEVLLSVSGLPKGVSGTFSPNPLLNTQTKATLHLTVAADAPDTNFVVTDATITANPIGGAETGSGLRTTKLSVRVAANFALSVDGFPDTSGLPEGRVPILAPDCAAVEVPLRIRRDISFNQAVTLSIREDEKGAVGLPADVSAEILPSPVISPGGGLDAERTLRIRAGSKSELALLSRHLVLIGKTGTGAGEASHQLPLDLVHARGTATIEQGQARTPRFGGNGTLLRIQGSGFCPGTTFEVGNRFAKTQPLTLGDHTAELLTPRNATTGGITVVPPGQLPKYRTEGNLAVDSFRNTEGFQFENYDTGSLSLGEFTRAFGADDLFIKVNLCFPFGDCSVPTGVLNPFATLEWGIMRRALTGGHCFGISLAAQRLAAGKDSLTEFAASDRSKRPTQAFDLSGPDGPASDLRSYLYAMHARQASEEFITEFYDRPQSLQAQIDTIEKELAHHRAPIISMRAKDKSLGGHAVVAYDMTQTPEKADITVYDNNVPFESREDSEDFEHVNRLNAGVIHIDKVKKLWTVSPLSAAGTISIPDERGGNDGTIWAVPFDAIPNDPSLPGEDILRKSLEYVVFGSRGAAAAPVASPAADAELLPTLNGTGAIESGGTFVRRASGKPFDVTVRGRKDGTYSQGYVAPGFIASVDGVATAKGLRDHVRGSGDALTFSSGRARPLAIKLAQELGPKATRSATLETHASAAGSDSVGFADNGALTYAHDGAPTAIDFSLTTIRPKGGPATFASGPVRVHNGDRLSVRALAGDPSRMRLTIRNGVRTVTRTLRNHAHSNLHLRLAGARVKGHRLSTRLRVSGGTGHAVVGAVLRLMRGDRLVAQRAVSVKASKRARKISWRLPHAVGKGHYRLLTIARAVAIAGPGSTGSASVDARRSSRVSVKR
jgi:hypothetical protein